MRLDGRLEIRARHAAVAGAQPLLDGVLAALRALAEHCLSGAESGYSAADFPGSGITDAEFEALLRALDET